jgi:hypothetical protein
VLVIESWLAAAQALKPTIKIYASAVWGNVLPAGRPPIGDKLTISSDVNIAMTSTVEHHDNMSLPALFQVYLRLRPPAASADPGAARFINVQPGGDSPTHITLSPPNENRRRAVERFAFTRIFEESASQLKIFTDSSAASLVDGVLAGRDGLVATLGVSGSGKVGSREARIR